jgi:hypothetical protein
MACRRCPHARRPFLWDAGYLTPPATYPDGRIRTQIPKFTALARRNLAPSLFGLAPGGVCRATGVAASAVRSYRTFSPLPPRPISPAQAGELGMGRRSVLCGTFPRLAPAGRYPAPFVHGARTFLSGNVSVLPERPPGRLTSKGMATAAWAVKRRDDRSHRRALQGSSLGHAWRAGLATSRRSIHHRPRQFAPGENGAEKLPLYRA